MQTKPSPPSDLLTPSVIRLVLAYEDFEAEKRAHRACQQLGQAAGSNTVVNLDSWKFDVLKLPAMRKMATQAVGEAQLVVLASQDGETLPSVVLDWIRSALRHDTTRPKALLLLMGPAPEELECLPVAKHTLKELVTRSGIPFWCLRTEAPNGAWEEPAYSPADLGRVTQAIFQRKPTDAAPVPPKVTPSSGK